MRFIYTDWLLNNKTSSWDWTYGGDSVYTIEDTQDEIIWLIQDYKAYEEMREYYVKN